MSRRTGTFSELSTSSLQVLKKLVVFLFLFIPPFQTLATAGITYTGKILDADNVPVTSSDVRFTVTIYDALGQCWLYTEQRQLDLSQSSGTFSFDIGSNDSTLVPASAAFNNSASATGVQNMTDVFSNVKSFTGLGTLNSCSGTYTPNPSDLTASRVLAIYFSVGGGSAQALPTLKINPVPSALTVAGYGTGELLKVSGSVSQATNTNTALSQTQYDEFWRLIKNPLAAYLPTTGDVTIVSGNNKVTTLLGQALPAGPATNGQVLVSNGTTWTLQAMSTGSVTSVGGTAPISSSGGATPSISISQANTTQDGYLSSTDWNTFNSKQSSALTSSSIWVGNSSGGAEARAMSGDATISNTGVLTLSSTITAGGPVGTSGYVPVITYDAKGRLTAVTSAAVNDSSKLPLAGGTMSGAINMGAQDITNTGNISMAANKYFGLSSNSTDGTVAGQMWYDGGLIKYFDGSTVKSLGVAGAGITNLNGLSSATQSFVINTAGTDFGVTSSGSAHTFSLPNASATARGALTSTDWSAFNSKQSNALADGSVWIGNASGGAEARAMSGDATISNSGVLTVDKTQSAAASKILQLDASSVATTKGVNVNGSTSGSISLRGQAAAGTYTLTLPSDDGSANQFLQTDGSGNLTWAAPSATLPGLNAGLMWVGNSSNGPEARTLSGDISAVSDTGSVTVVKTTTAENNKILALNGSGVGTMKGLEIQTGTGKATIQTSGAFTDYVLTLPSDDGAANQVLKTDGSGVLSWVSVLTGVSNTADLADAKMWVGNASGKAMEVSMSGDATMSNAGVLTLASTITAGGPVGTSGYVPVITYDAKGRLTAVTSAAVNDTSKLPLAGGTMTGAIAMGANDITNTGNISMAANKYFGLSSNSTDGTVAGQMWYDGGTIKYYDGSTVKSLGVAGAGITSLNGLTSGTQTFAIGTSGNAPSFNSVTDTHTLNIPMASASGSVTAGLLSNAEYAALNAKQSNALADASIWVGNSSGGAQARAMSGDATISNTGVLTVDKTQSGAASKILQLTASSVAVTKGADIGGAGAGIVSLRYPNTATNTTLTFPNSAGSANQFLQTDGAGNLTWAAQSALLPSLAATKIWVGNASGGPEAQVLGGDVSAVSNTGSVTVVKTTTGESNKILALDGSGVANVYGASIQGATSGSVTLQAPGTVTNYSLTFPAAQGGSGQVLSNNGSGVLSWVTPNSGWTAVDASYAAKGIVQFDTNAATSGVVVSSGVAAINAGTGANQIVKLDASSKLPAVDGSALTNLNADNIASGTLPVGRGGTGASSFSNYGMILANATGTALTSLTCAVGESAIWTVTGWICGKDFYQSGSASSANYVRATGSAAAGTPILGVAGADTHITMKLQAKGTGYVQTESALNVNSTYIERAPSAVTTTASTVIPTTANLYRANLAVATTVFTMPACPAATDTSFSLTVKVAQDATGNRTVDWTGASITWDSGTEPEAATAANSVSIYQFLCFGGESTWYGMMVWKAQ